MVGPRQDAAGQPHARGGRLVPLLPIDYRIGTAYMGEHITDNLKRQAMQVPFSWPISPCASGFPSINRLQHHLRRTSRRCRPFWGQARAINRPRRPALRGIHAPARTCNRRAEINRAARHAHPSSRGAARHLWLSPCDLRHRRVDLRGGGPPRTPPTRCCPPSTASTLMLWIEDTEAHRAELIRRFDLAPKPMYYHPDFPSCRSGRNTVETNAVAPEAVDPDAFVRSPMPARSTHLRAALRRHGEKLGRPSVTAAEVEGRCATRRTPFALVAVRPWQTWPDRLGRATARHRITARHAHSPALQPARLPRPARRGASWSWAGVPRPTFRGYPPAAHRSAEPDAQERSQTETQFARLIGATPLSGRAVVDPDDQPRGRKRTHAAEHMEATSTVPSPTSRATGEKF